MVLELNVEIAKRVKGNASRKFCCWPFEGFDQTSQRVGIPYKLWANVGSSDERQDANLEEDSPHILFN
jgi:hypothetical protein